MWFKVGKKTKNKSIYDDCAVNDFQLENLINNHVPFLLFYVSVLQDSTNEMLNNLSQDSILKNCVQKMQVVADMSQLRKKLKNIPANQPVVLICQDGVKSSRLAYQLRKKNFVNMFFVEGGMEKLLHSINNEKT